jgi:hypothetical protein
MMLCPRNGVKAGGSGHLSRQNGERACRRGWRPGDGDNPSAGPVVQPAAEHPYGLKNEPDGAWARRPPGGSPFPATDPTEWVHRLRARHPLAPADRVARPAESNFSNSCLAILGIRSSDRTWE